MQLVHTPGAITFAVCISLHMSKAELGPNHPTCFPKFASAK